MPSIERSKTDILILGSGGAGLFAALHALKATPDLDVTIAVKGLLGKSGCTRMVQGGYNLGARRLTRTALHGHHHRRKVAAAPGSRLAADRRRGGAHS
jgi:succinate dehydrogenase/fumarate reductase flavoprotein subunit